LVKKQKEQKCNKQQVWTPPPADFLKINTDGAFRQASCSGGWGFSIKNEQGKALVAGAGNLEFVADPFHAETAAMCYAVQAAVRMGCQKVILETDAATLQQALTSNMYDNSMMGALIREMKSIIELSFQCCKIVICQRTCNVDAHCLAAFGVNLERGKGQVWRDPFPEFVQDLVAGICPAC
jgi:ribonuclease HI